MSICSTAAGRSRCIYSNICMREEEAIYRDLHHAFADALAEGRIFPEVLVELAETSLVSETI